MDALATPLPTLPNTAWLRKFQRQTLAWYAGAARDLPWRENRDPYRIWISEIMLQQTQVATVRAYFQRFVAAFPTVADLAAADEAEVLRLWEGLGYYRRARQLHAAAQQIVELHAGQFPRDFDAVLALPGIGRYTAGAICSIAYDAQAPILEANTIRLHARLLAYREDPTKTAGQRLLWQFAEHILPNENVSSFNQALMELGSEICTPRNPQCEVCPVATLCRARQEKGVAEIPAAKKKMQYEDRLEVAIVVRRKKEVLLRQCGPDERWAGLWDFPRFHVASEAELLSGELASQLQARTGLTAAIGSRLTTIKHGVTRYRITLHCHEAEGASGRLRKDDAAPLVWAAVAQLHDFALSTTGRKIARLLAK
ncbi:A/G-specific adenine glycosylase [Blastopirellula sp. JC732]|uniref:Adenine DNA glycosylase n=1 Tax=Blastopirellula sediminis TaxID=2894196 RepID=A0A9X1SH14_9BACT|nr:A/G-specific adenine glycosylase [Blastopirellula sediminis]MCC9607130.1 A/G-specific adenine glycosylase [Blastopirellula sediminis]MCC9629577.1 A/G-specific adenine glycosylase [Blastopirellula sediminis]